MIVCAGEALVDLMPEPRCGGGPMNVAVTAARLGAPAAFVGRVSTDAFGDQLWAHLRGSGVDLASAERGPEPTATATVEHGPSPRFRFQGEGTADTCLSAVDLTPLGDGPHILHGGTLGLFRGVTAETLATLAESGAAGFVSLDPNARPQIIDDRDRWFAYFRRWLAVASIVKVSTEDLAWIWPDRVEESVADELRRQGVAAVIVTRGSDGVVAHLASGPLPIPTPRVAVVDTVGAGDAFCGGLLARLWAVGVRDRAALEALDRAAWAEAVDRAVLVAAITCTRAGADPPWARELSGVA